MSSQSSGSKSQNGGSKRVPIKTYSRRVKPKVDEVNCKKRIFEEDSSPSLPVPVKKIKRASIQDYFQPVSSASSHTSASSIQTSSDSIGPPSTPPSSPPSRSSSPIRKIKKAPRRLRTRPRLALAKMSRYDIDEVDNNMAEIIGSMHDDSRVREAEEYVDREEEENGVEYVNPGGDRSMLGERAYSPPPSNKPSKFAGDDQYFINEGLKRSKASLEAAFTWPRKPAPYQISDIPSEPIDIPKKKKPRNYDTTQTVLDFGQRRLIVCHQCGMPYDSTSDVDVRAHDVNHRDRLAPEPASLDTFLPTSEHYFLSHKMRIYDVNSTASTRQRLEDALDSTYKDLPGLMIDRENLWQKIRNPNIRTDPNPVPRYTVVTMEKIQGREIISMIVVERIGRAVCYQDTHGVVGGNVPYEGQLTTLSTSQNDQRDTIYNVYISIDRMWTKQGHLRTGIASRLIDHARRMVIPGFEIARRQIAFSPPTTVGAEFAAKYCKTVFKAADFLINIDDTMVNHAHVTDDELWVEPKPVVGPNLDWVRTQYDQSA